MAELRKTDVVASVAIHPRSAAADSISALIRENRGSGSQSLDLGGVELRSDRIAVSGSARFTEQIERLHQLAVNASRAASLLDVADRGLSAIAGKLERMDDLARFAAGSSDGPIEGFDGEASAYSVRERALIDNEFVALRDDIDRIVDATDFHGIDLLKGNPDSLADPLELSFDVRGTGAGVKVRIAIERADVAGLSDELPDATLGSEASAGEAVIAVSAAAERLSGIQEAVRAARTQIEPVEDPAGTVSAVLTRVRDEAVSPETVLDLARIVANRIAEEGGIDFSAGAEKSLQELMLRVSASTANGGPASGGDGIEAFGGKTAGAPTGAPATALAEGQTKAN